MREKRMTALHTVLFGHGFTRRFAIVFFFGRGEAYFPPEDMNL
jgi:hypothetical protein